MIVIVQVNETLMRDLVTDRNNDYIFVTDFHVLANHLNRLINQACRTELPSKTPTPTFPVITSPPHIGASML